MKPWHDCPKCPHCGDRAGVPQRAWDWNHRAKPGDNLACPACGGGWVGKPGEVAQAERALVAWERQRDREMAAGRRAQTKAEMEERYRRAMRGEWATPPKRKEEVPF